MDSIEKNIYNLILKYIKNGKEIDEHYFCELVKMLVEKESLRQYVKHLVFDDSITGSIYLYKDKTIALSLQELYLYFLNECQVFSFKGIEKDISKFLICTEFLVHEIEHVKQVKILDSESDSLEKRVLRASNLEYRLFSRDDYDEDNNFMRVILIKWHKLYLNNYRFCPEERMAEINSYKKCFEISRHFNSFSLRLTDYFLHNIYKNCLLGYNKYSNPTKFYISKVNPRFDFNEIEEIANCSTEEEKILCGLEVDENYKRRIAIKRNILYRRLKNR